MTPAQYNQLRGQGLAVICMAEVHVAIAEGNELNMRQLAIRLAKAAELKPEQLENLYFRTRRTLRSLEASGLLILKTEYHATKKVNVTVITLPPNT